MVAGKYRIENVLGRGGMGIVASAVHTELGTRVALKTLLPGATSDADSIARFAREARSASQLRSEHVVRVFDVGKLDDGTPYLVMEHLEGEKDPKNQLSYAIVGGDLAFRFTRTNVRLEYLARRQELDVGDPTRAADGELSSRSSVLRYTFGAAFSAERALRFKASGEVWQFSDRDAAGQKVSVGVHLAAVGTF